MNDECGMMIHHFRGNVEPIIRDDPCLVFALAREERPFRKHFSSRQALARHPGFHHLSGPACPAVTTLITGVGQQRMRQALGWLLSQPAIGGHVYRPRSILSAGFSGALREDLRVGDLIVGTEVVDEDGRRWPVTAWQQVFNLLDRPRHVGILPPQLWRGPILTTARFVSRPEDKMAVADRHGTLAVDMESATVAELCHRQGVPFACLRVISDDVHTLLSEHLDTIVDNGQVMPWRLLKRLLRSPQLGVELWRLGRQTRIASQRLAEALWEWLHTMGS